MTSKLKPYIVTFKDEKDVDTVLGHMNNISKTTIKPVDMTHMYGMVWSILAPGLRLLTSGANIFVRLYCFGSRIFSIHVDDVEDAEGQSIKDLLK